MAGFIYRSLAGLAGLAAAGVAVAIMLGIEQGVDAPAASAQSPAGAASSLTAASPAKARVTVVSPTVEDVHRVTTQPAHLEAYERTDILAKASGFISSVLVDIGDRVEKDQILAELWIPEMEQEERQKAALVEQARAAVQQAQARLDSAEALIAAAEAKLAESQATIDEQEAELDFRRSEHKRISDLVASRSVNASLQDEKLKQVQAAQAALAAAKAQVRSAAANIKVEQARQLEARSDVAFAEAQWQVAQADLEQVRILMKYAQIRAPYAGLITHRAADTGDFIASAANSASQALFTMDRIDRLRIIFDVPESESALIHVGQPTSLVVDALKGRSFPGQIARTAGVLHPGTRTLRVEAELDEPDPALRPGMYGMITVTLAEKPQAVSHRTGCLHFVENQLCLLCMKRGSIGNRPVGIGLTQEILTEITSGFNLSDATVITPVPRAVPAIRSTSSFTK